jgi:hypothetical protein
MFMGNTIREVGNAKPRDRCACERVAVVCFEPTLRLRGDNPLTIHEPPCFVTDKRLMGGKFVWRLRRAMLSNIVRTGNELAVDLADAFRDQVRIAKGTNPDRTVESVSDQIDEAIAIGSIYLKLWMVACHVR